MSSVAADETVTAETTADFEARLPAKLRERLELLHEVSRELISILDREELLERVAELIKPLIDYQLLGVMLWNEDAERLESVISVRWDGCASHKPVLAAGEGLCGTVALTRRPVRVADVRNDARYLSCGDRRVRSELVLPLLVKDRLIGVFDLESHQPDAFSAEDEHLLLTLAATLAVALENARLYERVRADERHLARELEAAREMQRVLLPRRTPWVPGLQTAVAYCPARQLGGDLYDFVGYGEGRTAIVVGDVAGKGTGSALYASMAIGLIRGYVADNRSGPSCFLSYLNAELRQLEAGHRFLALAVAVFDPRDASLTIASSGLPYPILVRGGQTTEIELPGVPLGRLPDVDYPKTRLELRPGDVVVFTTDGIDECRNRTQEPFGSDRVHQLLQDLAPGSAQDVAEGLLDATTRHAAGAEPSDDRTVVVLKVTDGCCVR